MKNALQFSFLILTIQFLSCGNSQNQENPSSKSKLVRKIIFNPQINKNTRVNGDVKLFTWFERKGKIENEKVVEDFTYGSYVIKYDKKGNIIEHSSYGRDKNHPFRAANYKYENGYLAEWIESSFDKNGAKIDEYSYEKYVYEGDKVKAYRYSDEGEVIFYYEIEFDDKGRKVSEFTDNKFTEEDKQKMKYYYDKNGHITRKTETWISRHFETDYEVVYQTDSHGNITEETRYDLETPKEKSGDKVEYKYDSKGNWIRKVSYDKKDGMIFIHDREIEYK